MSGCYGNSPEDRYFEGLLFSYLDGPDNEDEDFDNPDEEEEDTDPSFPPREQEES